MSLVPTFVRCADGKYYAGLVYNSAPVDTPKSPKDQPARPGRDWFVCFDDDEPVEVVIRSWPGAPSVGTVVAHLGLPAKCVKASGRGAVGRVFTGSKIRNAISYFLEVVEGEPFPTPRPGVDKWNAVHDVNPWREGVYYGCAA